MGGGTFTTPPTLIDPSYTQGVLKNVYSCYNSQNNEIIFSWTDTTGTKDPYYSIYNATSKTFTTPPTKIDATYTQGVWNDIFSCYNSLNNEIIFSWDDNSSSGNPYYAIYNATSKTFTTPPTKIDATYTQGVYNDVFCCYNSLNNEIIFSWTSFPDSNPYYSIYNATSKTFTTLPTKIDATYTQGVNNNVFCCYNSLNNEIIFSWPDNTGTKDPYYCVYNATSKTCTTAPTQIVPSYTEGVRFEVFSCYDSRNNQIFLNWKNNENPGDPYYCIYNADSKTFSTPPKKISTSYTNGVWYNVASCYNRANNQVVFTWGSYNGTAPYYSIYDVGSQTFTTPPTLIDINYTQGVWTYVFCCYNTQNNQTIFSWADKNHQNPYYCIYTEKFPATIAANRLLNASRLSSKRFQQDVVVHTIPTDN